MIIEAREDTITLRGTIKSDIWPAIQAAAALLLKNHPTGIIIDCSALSKITPKGAETFTAASRYITEKNARIVVAGLAPELLEIGKAVPGVRSQLPTCSTVEEARASLSLEEVAPERGRARTAGVVPMLGDWKAALDHAQRLAKGENAEIHLVDLIRVPRTLPIGTPLPDRETSGQERLEEAKARLKEAGFKGFYAHVERVRSDSQGLVDFVGQLKADFAVVSIDRGYGADPHIDEAEAMSLMEIASFELSLVKGARHDHKMPPKIVVPVVGSWDHAMEHACKLAEGERGVVTAASLIAVPRSEPIDAPKPDAEAAASDAAKEANRIGRPYNVTVNPVVERVRDPILGFIKMVKTQQFDMAVVGVKRETTGDYHIAHSIASALLDELPCETVFLRTGE